MKMCKKQYIRALQDKDYDYYELLVDLGGITPKGAIFVHDKNDHDVGSVSEGCLKLCWDQKGDCYRGDIATIAGETVIFHAEFRKSSMFRLVQSSRKDKLIYIITKLEKELNVAKKSLMEYN